MTIICIGEGLIDLIPADESGLRTANTLDIFPGGAPLNVAIGLQRLGVDSMFLGRLSGDTLGQRLSNLLKREGVARLPNDYDTSPTRLALVDHDNEAEPFRFYGDSPADSRLRRSDINDALVNTSVDGIYLSSLMMIDPSSRAIQRYALDQAAQLGIPVYSDPNPRPSVWDSQKEMVAIASELIAASMVAKLSLDDARVLGWPDAPDLLIRFCDDEFNTKVLVTAGAAGIWMITRSGIIHEKMSAVEAIDPTGAGDASFAALIAALQRSRPVRQSTLRFVAAAGAIAVQRRGAVNGLATLNEIEELLANWN